MPLLTMPIPQLQYDPPGPAAQLEKQVNITLATVTYADGQATSPDQLQKIGAFVYRVAVQGGGEEIWNDTEQVWQPAVTDAAALAALTPVALAFKQGEAAPWQGMLVTAGQKDKQGASRYDRAVNGRPVYHLRAFAQFKRDGITAAGVSAPRTELNFVSAVENQRFAITFDTTSAADCTRARLQIKNPALQPAGYVELRASGPEIEIANCDAAGQAIARVLLTASGDIELYPATGRKVLVQGDLEAGHVRYLPAGGGVKQDL